MIRRLAAERSIGLACMKRHRAPRCVAAQICSPLFTPSVARKPGSGICRTRSRGAAEAERQAATELLPTVEAHTPTGLVSGPQTHPGGRLPSQTRLVNLRLDQ